MMQVMQNGAGAMVLVAGTYCVFDVLMDKPFLHWAGNWRKLVAGTLTVLIAVAFY